MPTQSEMMCDYCKQTINLITEPMEEHWCGPRLAATLKTLKTQAKLDRQRVVDLEKLAPGEGELVRHSLRLGQQEKVTNAQGERFDRLEALDMKGLKDLWESLSLRVDGWERPSVKDLERTVEGLQRFNGDTLSTIAAIREDVDRHAKLWDQMDMSLGQVDSKIDNIQGNIDHLEKTTLPRVADLEAKASAFVTLVERLRITSEKQRVDDVEWADSTDHDLLEIKNRLDRLFAMDKELLDRTRRMEKGVGGVVTISELSKTNVELEQLKIGLQDIRTTIVQHRDTEGLHPRVMQSVEADGSAAKWATFRKVIEDELRDLLCPDASRDMANQIKDRLKEEGVKP